LRHLRYFEIYCLMIYVNFFSHVTPTCSYRFLFFFCLHMRSYGKWKHAVTVFSNTYLLLTSRNMKICVPIHYKFTHKLCMKYYL